MVDFARLVLGPAMAVFGRPVTVLPTKSRPGTPAYPATGIYRAQPIDMEAEAGPVTTQKHILGIQRLAFAVQPCKGDTVTLDDGRVFVITEYHMDGQGGADLTLKQSQPGAATP